jgi:hypothetical protein
MILQVLINIEWSPTPNPDIWIQTPLGLTVYQMPCANIPTLGYMSLTLPGPLTCFPLAPDPVFQSSILPSLGIAMCGTPLSSDPLPSPGTSLPSPPLPNASSDVPNPFSTTTLLRQPPPPLVSFPVSFCNSNSDARSSSTPSPTARARRSVPPSDTPPMSINSCPSKHTLEVHLPSAIQPEMVTISAKKGNRLVIVADAWHMETDCKFIFVQL